MGNKAYFFTKMEFALLLTACGIDKCYCFDLGLARQDQKSGIIKALHGLSEEDGLFSEYEGFQVTGEIREMIDGIARCGKIARYQDQSGKATLCYLSDIVILLEQTDQDQLRITSISLTKWGEWIFEKADLPEAFWEEAEDAEAAVRENQVSEREKATLMEGTGEGPPRKAILEIMDPGTEKKLSRYSIFQGLLNVWIAAEDYVSGRVTIREDSYKLRECLGREIAGR